MKVQYLLHNPSPDLRLWAEILAEEVAPAGMEVSFLDLADHIPTETDPKLNKGTHKVLKELIQAELVHCFGYRASWAIGDWKPALPWVYSVLELPRSTHDHLIERLNRASAGFVSSEYVKTRLGWYGCDYLKLARIGLPKSRLPDGPAAENETDCPQILVIGPEASSSVQQVLQQERVLQSRIPQATVRLADHHRPFLEQLQGVDLAVFPQPGKGSSFALLQALASEVPVLVPEDSGLAEVVEDRTTGLWFDDQDSLPDMICSALQMPIRARSMAQAAGIRQRESESLADCAELTIRLYRKIVNSQNSINSAPRR